MPVTAKAYAKINLYLDITGKRSDGYHELDSVFQSVSLCDEVTVSLCQDGIVVVCDRDELSGRDNIVYKACELFFSTINYSGGARVQIKKNIPVAAGLAGGSADAAATLFVLNQLLGNKFSLDGLCGLALKLGADVPFCLVGGTARVKGIGEQITPVKTPELHYVLIKEREKQSTGKMFSLIDNTEYSANSSIDNLIDGMEREDIKIISQNLFNAFAFCWDFDEMASPFNEFSPLGVFLSGSGPTVCALFNSQKAAKECAKILCEKGFNAFYAHSVNTGVVTV